MTDDIRNVYYVSDSTGITVESLGKSMLSQFDGVHFVEKTLSFIDNSAKAKQVAEEISKETSHRPIVFFTFANQEYAEAIKGSGALTFDCLEIFTAPLAKELNREPLHVSGKRWDDDIRNQDYQRRIDALNFTMSNDDGISVRHFNDADIVLIGVSRSGKTPTSLYLALHYGVYTANYPLVNEDLETPHIPDPLRPHRHKLYGLTIAAGRLSEIRHQRRPNSRYADLSQCQGEIAAAQRIFNANEIPYLDVTKRSVEELASKIMQEAKLTRYL